MHEPATGGGEVFEETGAGGVAGVEGEPDHGGDAEGELRSGCPFAEAVGGEDLAGFDGDLAEAGDEEFAADDEGGGPDGAEAASGEENVGGADEDLVGEGVHELAKGGDESHFSGEPAIEPIAGGGDAEEDEAGGESAESAL